MCINVSPLSSVDLDFRSILSTFIVLYLFIIDSLLIYFYWSIFIDFIIKNDFGTSELP